MLRRTKHGDRLVRASPGGWSARIEESFLDGLEATGCVRAAARAAGLSVNAFYKRRDAYPEFRARWDERVARFGEQLPGLLNAAAVESMSPQPEGAKRRGRARLPKVGVGEAIRIAQMNQKAKARGRASERNVLRKRELSEEELVEAGVRLLGQMKQRRNRQRLADGWTDAGDGVWLPPGWTAQRPESGEEGGQR